MVAMGSAKRFVNHLIDDPELVKVFGSKSQGMCCLVGVLGMLPEEAINAATINGAYAMELEKECGRLSPGKLANFIILEEGYESTPPPRYSQKQKYGKTTRKSFQVNSRKEVLCNPFF